MYANELVTTRRAIENKNTSCSQFMEPGASRRVSSAYVGELLGARQSRAGEGKSTPAGAWLTSCWSTDPH
eukprot:1161011-Pelagomonas_calceolata.AAC.1